LWRVYATRGHSSGRILSPADHNHRAALRTVI
jgi:hypothetical protein